VRIVNKPKIVIIGAGFAGYHCARRLAKSLGPAVDITLINPTDYFLYVPLLPPVTGGILDPRRITVSLSKTLPGVRVVLGEAERVDFDAREVAYKDPDDRSWSIPYDRLVLAAGSVNKLLPVPGITDHAHGYRGIPEALYLRDQLIQQVELADGTDDPTEREARLTFVVVGAGYTGTEVAAHGQMLTRAVVKTRPRLRGSRCRWLLLDTAKRVLPGLDPRLSKTADRVLRGRGMEIRTGTSVAEARADGVVLSDGSFVPTRTLIWCVGVRPDPFVDELGQPTDHGRLTVDPFLNVPGRPEVFSCGDAAAVPDLTRPGELTAMTAQHAERQGKLAADNIAASFGRGRKRQYRHHDLGFVVDLAGFQAAANPLQVPLKGQLAAAVTWGYHLLAMPAERWRVASGGLASAIGGRETVQLGLVPPGAVPLDRVTPERPARVGAASRP
jgi:NADH:ubiquinone reductase (H+-translocating)